MRDPARDPKPGDNWLAMGDAYRTRTVVSVTRGHVTYRPHHYGSDGSTSDCSLKSWRRWCSKALFRGRPGR